MTQQQAVRQRSTMPARVADALARAVRSLYARHDGALPFHGWHHISFVRDKAMEFATRNGSDVRFVGAAALVHDVNYLVRRDSDAADGRSLRTELLLDAGATPALAERVDSVVCEAEMSSRDPNISLEAQALSDADTLFKALPITPVVLAHRYLSETGVTLRNLASKIVGDQQRAYDGGFYFYDREAAATYSSWAVANLRLWQCVLDSLDDPVVGDLVQAIDATLADRAS
ncbi:MAG TPA: HD family phosphohydrolase [Pseudonocardiaceae bacterium]